MELLDNTDRICPLRLRAWRALNLDPQGGVAAGFTGPGKEILCDTACEGPSVEPRQIGGHVLPRLFNKTVCGMPEVTPVEQLAAEPTAMAVEQNL